MSMRVGMLPPFGAYAQLLRMLVPAASKIVIYDGLGSPIWSSDGVEDETLRQCIDRVVRDCVRRDPGKHPAVYVADSPTNTLLFPLSDSEGGLLTVVLVSVRSANDTIDPNRAKTLVALLRPLLDVVSYDFTMWRATQVGMPG